MKLYLLTALVLTVAFSCKQTTEPPPPKGIDTTNHNFVWHVDTLGDGNSSSFYDVAIINDTLAYAVGEIYLDDSVGNATLYNLAKWNGSRWELKRVTVTDRWGLITAPLEGIFAFSPTDIWLTGVIAIHGDGNNWRAYDIRPQLGNDSITMSKCWGRNPTDIYFVGRLGTIIHFTNGNWQRIESGTRLPIKDVWGNVDGTTGRQTVVCLASQQFQNLGKRVMKIESNSVIILPDSGLWWSLSSLWFGAGSECYIVGSELFKKANWESSASWDRFYESLTQYYSNAIRGDGVSIAVAGDFGSVLTYNGATWRNHQDDIALMNSSLRAVGLKGKLLMAVGEVDNKGVVVIGRRN